MAMASKCENEGSCGSDVQEEERSKDKDERQESSRKKGAKK